MIAVDASLLIALIEPEDRHHVAADDLLKVHLGEDLVLHSITMAEVLVGGVNRGHGSEMLADLEELGVLVVEPGAGEPLRLATLRAMTGLKMPDCCVLDTALSQQAALATFDETLAAAARNEGVRVLT